MPAARVETWSAAVRRIIEIEALSVESLVHVDGNFGSDEESLGHLEYKGRHTSYIVRRAVT